ncbi:MAG: PHP domain-containing protein, partial [Patescibacteria group bacterium]
NEVEKYLGFAFQEPKSYSFTRNGDRLGWKKGSDSKWSLTLFVEGGRVVDKNGLNLKSALREIAQNKGYKLNEYGLFDKDKLIAGKTEKEIYEKLGLEYIEPEMRENAGEIEATLRQAQGKPGGLPKLVKYEDVKGDLQMHSTWSDGAYAILEMAQAAKKLGRQYIAITDHAGRLTIARGLKEKDLLKQAGEIDKVNKKISGIKILKGAEVDIDKEGNLHICDEALAKLDIVIGAIHDNFKMPKEAMTARICRAMANKYLDILAHPTGRLLGRREGYDVDWEKVFSQALKTNTIIEINAFPDRLDLSWQNVKQAVKLGVKLSIGTDAHSTSHLEYLELGVAVARRGWSEKKDIINTMSFEKLKKFLGQHKK